ncbi:MAG: hypothetical protein WCO60_14165 [Verrucomicrobiota bacterium]
MRWAIGQGFDVAALDVAVSQVGARIDVAACKIEPPRRVKGSTVLRAGPVMVFECKIDRADFLRDAKSEDLLREQLMGLQKKRSEWEESLRREFPTLREGETLFPEFDVYRFQEVGGPQYQEWVREIEDITRQLYSKGKLSRILRWKGANLHYVVAEFGVVNVDELPAGWGLLEFDGIELLLRAKAVWQDASEVNRWWVTGKIAVAATRSSEALFEVEENEEGDGTPGLFGKRS